MNQDLTELCHRAGADEDEHHFELLVPEDLAFFAGHFPDQPVLAAAAQLSVIVLPRIAQQWPDLGPMTSTRRVKLHLPIRPGDTLQLLVRRTDRRVRFEITRDGAMASSGHIEHAGPS